MKGKSRKWSIEELIDFEACMREYKDDLAGDQLIRSNILEPLFEERADWHESKKKELAFYRWTMHRLRQTRENPSEFWIASYKGFSLFLMALGFLCGIGAVLGIINWGDQSLNIALMIGVLVLLPWVLFFLFCLASKYSGGAFSFAAKFLQSKINKVFEKRGYSFSRIPDILHLPLRHAAFLALQKASLAYGFAGIISMLAVIFFFDISFFWQSSLGESMRGVWHFLCQALSFPWAWTGYGAPTNEDVDAIRMVSGESELAKGAQVTWALFSVGTVVVWSFIPRLIMLIAGNMKLNQTLSAVTFPEKSHRQLWRRLYVKPVDLEQEEEADNTAIVVDYGGWHMDYNKYLPFIHKKIRLNPVHRGIMATLDHTQEKHVLDLVEKNDCPIILCCEAGELSPPSLVSALKKFRLYRQDIEMHVVVTGPGSDQEDEPEWMDVWTAWVDKLADTKVNLYRFVESNEPAAVALEQVVEPSEVAKPEPARWTEESNETNNNL